MEHRRPTDTYDDGRTEGEEATNAAEIRKNRPVLIKSSDHW
jgi:hypothetical protein